MQGPSGEQYVTIIQDGQTYAIPATDYAAMMAQQGLEVLDGAGEVKAREQEGATPHTPIIPAPVATPAPPAPAPTQPPPLAHLTPCPPPHQIHTASVKTEAPSMVAEANVKVAGGGGPSMRWMTATGPPGGRTSKVEPRKQLYPTMQQVVEGHRQEAPRKNYQPIRVDNWGIFLLSRLQTYFTKKELCDLTLRFPAQNAQIKVHRLILSACTDYFARLEHEVETADPGQIDMPANFTPEALAPIIRFMYTGRLDLKESSYTKMYETAKTLQMSVLTKLMDAQVNGASVPAGDRKPVKRSNGVFDDDPVEQIRKIRKIEKRVAQEERRKLVTAKVRQEELARLPGKKLPIWKRRSGEGGVPCDLVPVEEVKVAPSRKGGYRIPKVGDPHTVGALLTQHEEGGEGQLIPPPVVSTTYRKRSPGEKPKIPRRLQEIQQHLMFEKILKTGTKNNVAAKPEPGSSKGDLSLEEVKALVEEQQQRMAAATQEEEEEDYYDDPADIGDDFIDADVDSPAPVEAEEVLAEEQPAQVAVAPPEEAKVMEAQVQTVIPEPEAQKKSVRFSLRPNPRPGLAKVEPQQATMEALPLIQPVHLDPLPAPALPLTSPSPISASEANINMAPTTAAEEEKEKQQISLTMPEAGPKVEGSIQTELDEALEEFSRVAEEEEAEELREGAGSSGEARRGPGQDDHTKPRRGRPPRWLKEQTMQMGEAVRRREDGPAADQATVINEVMKKYPNLFKENKQVSLGFNDNM